MAIGEIVRARVDPEIKNSASSILATAGLTISDAFRALLATIARDRTLPFDLFPTENSANIHQTGNLTNISNGVRPAVPLSEILGTKSGVPDGRMSGLSENEAQSFLAALDIP